MLLELPSELLALVLEYLRTHDLLACAHVCRQLRGGVGLVPLSLVIKPISFANPHGPVYHKEFLTILFRDLKVEKIVSGLKDVFQGGISPKSAIGSHALVGPDLKHFTYVYTGKECYREVELMVDACQKIKLQSFSYVGSIFSKYCAPASVTALKVQAKMIYIDWADTFIGLTHLSLDGNAEVSTLPAMLEALPLKSLALHKNIAIEARQSTLAMKAIIEAKLEELIVDGGFYSKVCPALDNWEHRPQRIRMGGLYLKRPLIELPQHAMLPQLHTERLEPIVFKGRVTHCSLENCHIRFPQILELASPVLKMFTMQFAACVKVQSGLHPFHTTPSRNEHIKLALAFSKCHYRGPTWEWTALLSNPANPPPVMLFRTNVPMNIQLAQNRFRWSRNETNRALRQGRYTTRVKTRLSSIILDNYYRTPDPI